MRRESYDSLAEMANGVVNEVDLWITEYVKTDVLEPDEMFEIPEEIKNQIAGLVASVVGEALVRHGPKQRDHHGNMIEAMNRLSDGL